MTLLRCFAPLLAGAVLMAGPAPAMAAALPFPDRTVSLSVVDQELPEVLGEIGNQGGFRVNVAGTVRGRVHGRLPVAPAESLLDRLAAMFGFQWFYDGETVFVSAPGESTSKLMSVAGVGVERLRRALDQLGISDKRWPIQTTAENDLALVRGPPRFLALVEQTLAALSPKGGTGAEVRVFRGAASQPF